MKNLIILITVFLLCLSPLSFASKIYKWTDSEGNTHYGERPPNQKATQIKVPKGPARTSTPSPVNQQDATNKLLDAFARERKDKKEAANKAATEKERQDKNCSHAKRRVVNLKLGGRQYEITDQGERRFLSDADIQTRLTEAQKIADQWCK
jgi:FKBP-type peptidyl-prolyl cis-trans isomerase